MNVSDVLAVAAVGALPVASIVGLVRQHGGRPGGRGSPAALRGPGRPRLSSARGQGPAGGRSRWAVAGAETGARWAGRADLRPLVCRDRAPGRLVLGSAPGLGGWRRRGRSLAAEAAQSLAVVGPSQSGKTTALAVPAILQWEGPVLAASVKTDLVRDTLARRSRSGTVWCFDPAGTTGLPQSRWSPLATAGTWQGARRLAADLSEVTRSESTSADGEFWYATAAKLLAPLLFAAAYSNRTMQDVVRWVDVQETEEVLDTLHAAGVPEALQAARATWLRDERQRSAVYTTAETILEPFADAVDPLGGFVPADTPPYGMPAPGADRSAASWPHVGGGGQVGGAAGGAVGGAVGGQVAPPLDRSTIDCAGLLEGKHTLYVCAPAHDQRRLRGVFVALVQQVVQAAFSKAAQTGRPLDPPLLVVLDEAANIAPLRDLDGLAATCAGHGVQLVTVWQDLAQVRARYGERGATVVNNHRAKLFLPGIADPGTLDFASQLAGTEERPTPSVTYGARGERTVTTAAAVRRLLPPDALRRMPRGSGVLLYGSLPPARIRLRPWFDDPHLRGGDPSRGRGTGGPATTASSRLRNGWRRSWRPLQSRR